MTQSILGWKFWICVLVVVCLTATQLQVTAFAQSAAPPPQSAQPAPVQTNNGSAIGRTLKWVFIGVATAAVAVAVVVLTKNDAPAEPVVTVGSPTVSSPQ